jgi:hypothetical protein
VTETTNPLPETGQAADEAEATPPTARTSTSARTHQMRLRVYEYCPHTGTRRYYAPSYERGV